jgi:dihydrofolate reductase
VDCACGRRAEQRDGRWERFAETADAVVIGSGTLRWLHGEGYLLPLRGKPVWLVSHDEELAAKAAAADPSSTPVTRVEGEIAAILDGIAAAGHEHVWIGGGGAIAGQALAADRLDEVILTPVRLRPRQSAFSGHPVAGDSRWPL